MDANENVAVVAWTEPVGPALIDVSGGRGVRAAVAVGDAVGVGVAPAPGTGAGGPATGTGGGRSGDAGHRERTAHGPRAAVVALAALARPCAAPSAQANRR